MRAAVFLGGTRQAVDSQDQPYFRFGVGVADWARPDPRTLVPVRQKCAHFASGKWQINDRIPESWPAAVVCIAKAPGTAPYGKEAPGWSIFCHRNPVREGDGATVFLHHDNTGYATRPDGPARTP